MAKGDKLHIRPHHGICIAHYIGYGYDERFVENMNEVTCRLSSEPEQEVILHISADVLCRCCPNDERGRCSAQEQVEGYDNKCLRLCGLSEGEIIRWCDFCHEVKTKLLDTGKWRQVCEECGWLSICGRQH